MAGVIRQDLRSSAGVLAASRLANFVVSGADPLRDIRNLRSVELVMKHGIRRWRTAYRPVTAQEMAQGANLAPPTHPQGPARQSSPPRRVTAPRYMCPYHVWPTCVKRDG
jgi:hypothetical protein